MAKMVFAMKIYLCLIVRKLYLPHSFNQKNSSRERTKYIPDVNTEKR